MKLAAFAFLVFGFAITGCYNPKVQSGGFACSLTDDPPCPIGFFCVNGLCLDHPGSGGGGGGGGGAVADMATPIGGSTDMAHAIFDFAQPAGDMATSACGMSGDDCSSTPCCAGSFCFPGLDVCF